MQRFATLDDVTNQWLPIKPTVTGQPGQRSAAALDAVVDALRPEHSARYQRHDSTTYCATFVTDATSALGCIIPHWTGPAGEIADPGAIGAREQRANDMTAWLRGPGSKMGWVELGSEREARAVADQGFPTVVIWNSGGPGPGHIALLVPGGIAQAGQENYRRATLAQCFAPAKWPALRWFFHA